jgi:hypothetical protein
MIKEHKKGPNVPKPNWLIIVDERTQSKFLTFHEKKNHIVEHVCKQLNKWKDASLPAKFIHIDNAGENKKLHACLTAWRLQIEEVEYMAGVTPQQNHLAELGFMVLANHGQAIMYTANIPGKGRFLLFREAFTTSTLLGHMTIEIYDVLATHYIHFAGNNPAFTPQHLKAWEEAGTVKTKEKTTPKL